MTSPFHIFLDLCAVGAGLFVIALCLMAAAVIVLTVLGSVRDTVRAERARKG